MRKANTTCSLTEEKRHRYRTTLTNNLLSVATIDLNGRKTPGYVFDVSASGIGLFFDATMDPGYPAGTVLWLCIKSPYLREPIVAPAQIRRITPSPLGRLYGFRLIEWKGLSSHISADVASIFNRRASERVKLKGERCIEIITEEPTQSFWRVFHDHLTGNLVEVSATGLSFRVGSESAMLIEPHRSVEVSFSLPKSDYRFSMWTEVLHCASGPDGISCGARFDPQRTELFDEKQERLITLLGGPSTGAANPPSPEHTGAPPHHHGESAGPPV